MGKIRLFCIPYVGASASVFWKWSKTLDKSIELVPIELAGRGKRFNEPFYEDLQGAVDNIFNIIENEINDLPYAIYGHSMGSLLAFELYYKIIEKRRKAPVHIFFSGRYPPHINKNSIIYHKLSDKELVDKILEIGGTSKEVFLNKELANIYISLIRSDYRILEMYKYNAKPYKLNCDISVFYGNKDKICADSFLNEWIKYTEKQCDFYEFDGDHFFINDKSEEVVSEINKILT